jgi:hypothetical protein
MANYRVSTNTNSSNKTTQDKKQKRKQGKLNQLRLFKLRCDLLNTSINLQTAFAADIYLAEGYVPSGNTETDSFQNRKAILVPRKAFIKNSASM